MEKVETMKAGYIDVPFSPVSAETPKIVVSFPPPNSEPGHINVPFSPKLEENVKTVVAPLPLNPTIGNPWSTGLFECTQHPTNAIMTAFFPCFTFGQIAEILDAGKISCPLGSLIYLLMIPPLCSSWIIGSKYRKRLRIKFGLVEAPYKDVFSHIFCPLCALCQEFRELKNRGLDPSVGWNGILAQQQQNQQAMVHNNPPPIQAMSK